MAQQVRQRATRLTAGPGGMVHIAAGVLVDMTGDCCSRKC